MTLASVPLLSVIIRTHNEAPRLRLTLASLEQEKPFEVVVTNDGSTDETDQVLREAARHLPLRVVHHSTPQGRSAASNAAAQVARGDVLLFLDGDTLAGPGCLAAHAQAHASQPGLVGRGATLHLRATRFLHDPQAGTPQSGQEARLARMPTAEREAMKVTVDQIRNDFGAVSRRAELGIYPGAGPRRLYLLETEALKERPDSPLSWVAASGSNQSASRDAFLATGGFDPEIDLNEHRELALRLCAIGQRMGFVPNAASYHLTHRSGWRNPLEDLQWEQRFLQRHCNPAILLLPVLWASLADRSPLPQQDRIESLAALELAAATLDRPTIDRLRALATSNAAPSGRRTPNG